MESLENGFREILMEKIGLDMHLKTWLHTCDQHLNG
jgi:hypothetical protein